MLFKINFFKTQASGSKAKSKEIGPSTIHPFISPLSFILLILSASTVSFIFGLTTSIADKTAKAELATQSEYITNMAYSRAYKKIKLRLDIGNELLQSIKKVISRRTSEYELGKIDGGRFKNNR